MKRPRNSKKLQAFDQKIIALVWDFDKTLICDYMQAPLFKRYQIDGDLFWREVRGLQDWYEKQGVNAHPDNLYLNHLLTYIEEGALKGLTREILREIGQELEYYPGLPDFFPAIKERIAKNSDFSRFDIKVEHYIVSTGFADTIRGSAIGDQVEGIWGCEFIEEPAPKGYLDGTKPASRPKQIHQIAMALDNTSKTRALFEISKGANKIPGIDVNSKMLEQNRRIPFTQMIYIADGPSDVPAFSILNQFGGLTYAIYPEKDRRAFQQVDRLRQDGRIDMFGPADYREGTQTWLWLTDHVEKIAKRIATEKEDLMRKVASAPPSYI